MANPRGVVAYLDYKGSGEGVTFTESILYDEWVTTKPVYIVNGKDPENGPFVIMEYKKGGELIPLCQLTNWDEFTKWEAAIRRNFAVSMRTHEPIDISSPGAARIPGFVDVVSARVAAQERS